MKRFKRVALASTLSVLVLVSPAQTFASEQQTIEPVVIKESDVKQSVQQVTPSSIYDNAIEFKEFERVDTYIRNKNESPRFFKIKFDTDGSRIFSFIGSQYKDQYKLFVYDEKYLTVGYRENEETILVDAKADQWYYVEIRKMPGSPYSKEPLTLSAGL
ncbi:hypothetical protein P4S95_16330 [Aneurinibacillus aneurinilyticus]|uniref:hypothetical protein n=1 Tax=Aneurinibacillus aneurinilyticus TaxID=1391 RepID=UPI002E2308E8|nr:hypothetical protein [Aneurinibacillus aneurinilyticus]